MLKAALGHSDQVEARDAIAEVLAQCEESLDGAVPGGGLLFSAISTDADVVLAAINERYPGVQLIGCTTDGELSSRLEFAEDSVALVLFHSPGLRFLAGVAENISGGAAEAIGEAVRQTRQKATDEPRLCIPTPESLTTSGVAILDALCDALGAECPVFGGVAGDQWQFERTRQFCNDRVLHDSAPFLLICGDVNYSSGVASGWTPIGATAKITSVEGNVVHTIGDKTAVELYQSYLGPHVTPSGEYPLALLEPDGSFYLRAPLAYDESRGSITFAADVPPGVSAQLTETTRDSIVAASRQSVSAAVAAYPGDRPGVVLVFSCAARKQLLGTRTKEEFAILKESLAGELPICGFYSYGEFGPAASGGRSRFHNETFVTLILGTE